ncbi:uncharacterized protein EDB91DRAFT_1335740 [Suillus paluster]|uniref:uncharacterized protein n=1 Tax=Suillus paluster TaxID=48578 RepID=UPI001B885BB9|nr:uncharacterized protein EDB91DRAFT_1335740 [Suillus paluster]KAG1743607.1 hypothetical protein EDB91DRAFT_1335740 [Suillus paluster]
MSIDINPTHISYIQIFPPIGIARLGDSGFDLSTGNIDDDSEIDWFLPSEIPGTEDMPADLGKFRDEKNRIKRQAVRFRVYAYRENGDILGEITLQTKPTTYNITWRVHVANHKGAWHEFSGQYEPMPNGLRNPDVQPSFRPDQRSDLIVDSKVQTITAGTLEEVSLTGLFRGSRAASVDVHLGEIRTNEQGHLIFIGGAGYSRSVGNPGQAHFQPDIISEFDSIDWVDDTCDGWVDVTVQHGDLTFTALQKSTVLSAPPKFSWGIQSPTTLYDLLENIYNDRIGWKDHDYTQFYQDIWPVMHGSYALSWVNREAYDGHGVSGKGNFLTMKDDLASLEDTTKIQALRDHIFSRLRLPDYEDRVQASTKYMPRLSGNDGDALEPGEPLRPGDPIKRFAAFTRLQYQRFLQWKRGQFLASDAPWSRFTEFDEVPPALQPSFLTRAALEHTVGEPLYPGIEVYWAAREPKMYLFDTSRKDKDPPFRFNHEVVKPGYLGRGLSLPWQSDFDQCNTHWWPSARPDDVINIGDFESKDNVPVEDFIRDIAPKTKKWTRGLRDTPDYPTEYYPGSTDMVRHWQKLGFVVKVPIVIGESPDLPVWAEKERMPIDDPLKHKFQIPFVSA